MGSIISAAEARTLPGLFQERIKRSPDVRAYMTPEGSGWREITWREIGVRAGRFRAALEALGLRKGDRVALLLPNGVDWAGFDMAALSLGLVVVPLYSGDSASNHAFVLDRCGVRMALVDTHESWDAIAALGGRHLEQVWVRQAAPARLCRPLRSLADVLPDTCAPLTGIAPEPDDLATLVCTSGATGRPKAVMLTHAAILWNAEAVTKVFEPAQSDVFLSLLPLAHALERTIGYYGPMMAGATVAYARSVDLLSEDLVAVRPTVLLAVPRLYERIYAAIHEQAAGNILGRFLLDVTARVGWKRFQWARGRGAPPGILSRLLHALLRRRVARRVLMVFGGRLRIAVSGGASLPAKVARFLVSMGLPLVEGYGLTEAAPVVAATAPVDYVPGSVGRPLQGSEVRLSAEGELLVRSPSLMKGYWNDAEATAAAFEAGGWLKTGDVAEIHDGLVFIRGRLTEIIVLSTGEKVSPQPIEAAILRDPLFEHACVLGDGKPFATAVLALRLERWRKLAGTLGADLGLPNAAPVKAEVLKGIARNLRRFSKSAQVRGVHLALDAWTVDDGLLTPTLKVKRHAIEAKYADEIRALYGGHAAVS